MVWLWNWDRAVQLGINHAPHSHFLDILFRFVTYLGLDQVLIPIVIALILARSTRSAGFTCFVAYALAGVSSIILKRLAPRLRPGNWPDTLVAPDEQIFHNSFPSGHTIIAFAAAFAFVLSYRGSHWKEWSGAALLLAFGVGFSRIYRGVHWPTDVLASMAVAFLAALAANAIIRWRQAEAARLHPSEGPA